MWFRLCIVSWFSQKASVTIVDTNVLLCYSNRNLVWQTACNIVLPPSGTKTALLNKISKGRPQYDCHRVSLVSFSEQFFSERTFFPLYTTFWNRNVLWKLKVLYRTTEANKEPLFLKVCICTRHIAKHEVLFSTNTYERGSTGKTTKWCENTTKENEV